MPKKTFSLEFKRIMEKANMTHSMSRISRCIDNGPIEAFWGTLKVKKYYLHKFETYEALKHAIDTYIKFYNHERYQETIINGNFGVLQNVIFLLVKSLFAY